MNKKPLYHAVLAAGYIALLASSIDWITRIPHPPQDNIFIPITMLCLLVLSVALMAFLFFYEPVLLLLDDKRPEAVRFFLGTVAIFAGLTAVFLALAIFVFP